MKLLAIDEMKGYSEPLKSAFLKASPMLMVDAAFGAEKHAS